MLTVFLFAGYGGLNGQDSMTHQLNINSLYLHTGLYRLADHQMYAPNFRILAPESEILKNNQDGYSKGKMYSFNAYSVPNVISIQLGFNPRNRRTKRVQERIEFRAGLSCYFSNGFSFYINKFEKHRYDSVQTGNRMLYYDSAKAQSINVNYFFKMLKADLSFLVKSKQNRRWSGYAGVGISAGISINNGILIRHRTVNSIYFNNYEEKRVTPETNESEYFRIKDNYSITAYLPAGIDFRIGKESPFWQRLHLFLEARPGINFQIVPEVITSISPCIQTSLGLRVKLQ